MSSQHYLVTTTLGTDRPKIASTVARHASSCGCNIGDSYLAVLREGSTSIMLPSGSWNVITPVESTLPLEGIKLDLLIMMKRATARPRPPVPAPIWVQIDAVDSPRLIERFTTLFDTHHTNIVKLVSHTQPAGGERATQSHTQVTTHSPASTDVTDIGQMFKALYTEPDTQGSINVTNYSQHDEQDGIR